jgi:PKD repeat protein
MRWLAAVLVLCVLVPLHANGASCIWISDDDSIRQIQTETNQVSQVVPLRNPHRLVMNANDCGVWTLDSKDRRLLRFGPDGALELDLRVRDLDSRLQEVEQLELDPYDGSLWISDRRHLLHLSPSGQVLGAVAVPGEVRRLQVGLDQNVWVLGRRTLWRFDRHGAPLSTHALGSHLARDARYFAVDSLAGVIWLADDDELVQIALSAPSVPAVRVRMPQRVTGFTLDPLSGNVWVAQSRALLAYTSAGAPAFVVALDGLGLRHPEKLAFDPVSRSLWAGAERSVARFTATGQFLVRLTAKDGDEALGVPAFKLVPTLSLVRPPQNALTNNPAPRFTLSYGAHCNGAECGFNNQYLGGYSLSATLNDEPVGQHFTFEEKSADAGFTPGSRLPEGANTFTAQVRDRFGHVSPKIENSFTVDTIPPKFVSVVPGDGTTLTTANVVIQGNIDDPGATVALAGVGLAAAGTAFSFPVTLGPGLNSFSLIATDKAGNATTQSLRLTYVPVSVTITSPANGSVVDGDVVTVSGTFQGPVNTGVTVNGLAAFMNGNTFIAAGLPLERGKNIITVIAMTPERRSASEEISVTSTGPQPMRITATPSQGISPLQVTFNPVNRSAKRIVLIRADFNGSGNFVPFNPGSVISTTYSTPGVYSARFEVVVDDGGGSTIHTASVLVENPARIDETLRVVWKSFSTALASRDIDGAVSLFNAQGQAKYRPVLRALEPHLPAIVTSFSPLEQAALFPHLAEYVVGRPIAGVNRLFFVYFARDLDGVWRLDSM